MIYYRTERIIGTSNKIRLMRNTCHTDTIKKPPYKTFQLSKFSKQLETRILLSGCSQKLLLVVYNIKLKIFIKIIKPFFKHNNNSNLIHQNWLINRYEFCIFFQHFLFLWIGTSGIKLLTFQTFFPSKGTVKVRTHNFQNFITLLPTQLFAAKWTFSQPSVYVFFFVQYFVFMQVLRLRVGDTRSG